LTATSITDGTVAWDATVDTDAKLDFPHYTELARFPKDPAPYRGANCMRVDLGGGVTQAYVEEQGDLDIANGTTRYFSFKLFISTDITMGDTDEFEILECWSSGDVAEGGIVLNFTTANGLRLGIGKGAGAQFTGISTGVWHNIEFQYVSAAGTGTLDAWVDNVALTQVASLTQAILIQVNLGAFDTAGGNYPATVTKGKLFFDDFKADEGRLYGTEARRWMDDVLIESSGHAFVGPGVIENVTLMDGGSGDSTVIIFDSDVGDSNDVANTVVELAATANNEIVDPAGMPAQVVRGCYVSLGGTSSRARIKIKHATAFGSDGAVKSYGLRR